LHNLETLRALIHSISLQRASLQLALSNLNRVMTGTSASFSVFLEASSPNFTAWTSLLDGWEDSMEAINKVSVVTGLIGRAGHARDGSTSSWTGKDKERFLGDYVSRDKMLAVRDGCAKVLSKLSSSPGGDGELICHEQTSSGSDPTRFTAL
jgi:autophagy-related protein 11